MDSFVNRLLGRF